MPLVEADIKQYMSGGAANSDGNASIGGVKSSNEAPTNLNGFWDLVDSSEASLGDVEYRCLYVHNSHGTITAQNVDVYISSNTPSGDTVIAVGLGTSAVSGTEQTIADEDTDPAGVSFSAPSTRGTGLSIGDLAPGESKAVWLRRTITSNASAYNNDQYTLAVGFDTAA